MRKIIDWLEHRTGLETAIKNFLYEDIPASSGWHQIIGSAAVFFFVIQIFTGGLLAFNYAGHSRRFLQQRPLHHDGTDRRQAHPRPAPLGRQHDADHRRAAHDPGVPLWRLQEAARSHLDGRRRSAAAGAGIRTHRLPAALGQSRVLGHRRHHADHRIGAGPRSVSDAPARQRGQASAASRSRDSTRSTPSFCRRW